MHRFRQNLKLIALGARLFQQIGRRRLAGKQQNLDLRQYPSNADSRIDSVQIGHDHIRDQHVRLKAGSLRKSGFAGVNGASLKPALIQYHGQRVGDHSFIVGNKDLGFRCAIGHTLLDELPALQNQKMMYNAANWVWGK